jgi:hypothetical protein
MALINRNHSFSKFLLAASVCFLFKVPSEKYPARKRKLNGEIALPA